MQVRSIQKCNIFQILNPVPHRRELSHNLTPTLSSLNENEESPQYIFTLVPIYIKVKEGECIFAKAVMTWNGYCKLTLSIHTLQLFRIIVHVNSLGIIHHEEAQACYRQHYPDGLPQTDASSRLKGQDVFHDGLLENYSG